MMDEWRVLTVEGQKWLTACLTAGYLNCIALQTIRGEAIEPCQAPLR